jgi:hypothetical protein
MIECRQCEALPTLKTPTPNVGNGRGAEYHSALRVAASLQIAAVHDDEDQVALPGRLPVSRATDFALESSLPNQACSYDHPKSTHWRLAGFVLLFLHN